jgi:hypothetical protein
MIEKMKKNGERGREREVKRDGDEITRWEREKDEERDHKEKMVMREREKEKDRKSRKKKINLGLANGCSGGDHTRQCCTLWVVS